MAATPIADDPSSASLHQRLQRIDRELRHGLEGAALHPVLTPAAELRTDAERWRHELRELARQLDGRQLDGRQLDGRSDEEAEALRRKVDALGRVLDNVERVTAGADPATALPRSPERWPEAMPRLRAAGPTHDDCANATPLALGAEASGTTADATQDGAASCGSPTPGPDVWYAFTAAASGTVSADTFGSGYDTVLSVHSACPGSAANELTCNDDAFGLQSAASFYAEAGQTYWIRVGGSEQATGAFTLRLGTGGDVSGTVTSATGAPLEGGQVIAYREAGGEFDVYAGTGVTNGAGEYSIAGLSAGSHAFLTDDFTGFLDELYDDVACPHERPSDCPAATPVAVPSHGDVTGIDFALDPGGAISGRVSHQGTGDPLSGIFVEIYDAGGDFIESDLTDAAGDYAVIGLPSGTYFAKAAGSSIENEIYEDIPCAVSWNCDPTTGTAIPVTAPQTTAGVDLVVDQRGIVSGVVTRRADGSPISGAVVTAYRDRGSYFNSEVQAVTDASGAYSIGGLEPGDYKMVAKVSGYAGQIFDDAPCRRDVTGDCDLTEGTLLAVALNAPVTGVDFALDLLGAVSGTVTHAQNGNPLFNVRVVVRPADGGRDSWTLTDSTGGYRIRVIAGTYHAMTAFSPNFIDEIYDDLPCPGDPGPDCDPASGTPVAVAVGTTASGIDFALDPGGAIAGTVTETGSGDPVSRPHVRVWDGGGTLVREGSADAYGHYTLRALPAGSYFVTAIGTPGVHFGELHDDLPCPGGEAPGCDPTAGTPVDVAHNLTTPGIDFALDHLGAVAGTVTDFDGHPIGGVFVNAWRVDDGAGDSAVTDPQGAYRIPGLPSGTYRIFTENFGSFVDEVYDDRFCLRGCDLSQGDAVEVAVNTTTGVSFVLGTLEDHAAIFSDGFESGDLASWGR